MQCDSLESILTYFKDTLRKKKDEKEFAQLFEKLRNSKMLYILHFFANIIFLCCLSSFRPSLKILLVLAHRLGVRLLKFGCYFKMRVLL